MPYNNLIVKKIGDVCDKALWGLYEPFEWTNGVIKVIVPAGFQCDFASIPQFALGILGDIGQEAGTIHDYLYRSDAEPKLTRSKADYIFFEVCGEMGITWWKRKAMYYAVRTFAGQHWQKRKVMEPFIQQEVWV